MATYTNITISATSPATATSSVGSAATVKDTSGNPLTGDLLSGFDSMQVTANLLGATGGTLDVYVQVSYDAGATWVDYIHYAQLANGAVASSYVSSHSRAKGQGVAVLPFHTLSVGTSVDGEWGTQARLYFTAGAGTSAGAVQTIVLHLENLRTAY